MGRNRSALRRAQSYRFEPPGADQIVADEDHRRRHAEARAKAIAWAVDAARDARVVYLDTETTGFGPRAEIVDIAVVSAGGELLFESLVQPERRIPRDASAIHGITDADVRNAPRWNEVYNDLAAILADRRIVVYNVTFDRQMVAQCCDNYALSAPAAEWECAMKKFAGFKGNWDPRKKWFSFVKLERAVLEFGAKPGGHRAAADTFACRAVVLGMASTPLPDVLMTTLPPSPTEQRPWRVAARDEAGLTAPGTLARWSHAAREFRALLEQTPRALRERPGACGVWSVRDVAAHAIGWEWEGARRLRLIAANPAEPDVAYDDDGFNAANVALRSRQLWAATLDELTKASHTFGMAAAALPDNARTREWLTSRAADFEQHTDEIRDWLDVMAESAGTPL